MFNIKMLIERFYQALNARQWSPRRLQMDISIPEVYRHPMWQPKEYILLKSLPGISAGARFQQTYQSDNVYFHAIAITSQLAEKDQVRIIQFEARHVENNSEWFLDIKEYNIKKDIRNDHKKFFYD